MREREADRQTQRETQRERQTDILTNWQTHTQRDRETYSFHKRERGERDRDRERDRERETETETETHTHTERQIDRNRERERDWETERPTPVIKSLLGASVPCFWDKADVWPTMLSREQNNLQNFARWWQRLRASLPPPPPHPTPWTPPLGSSEQQGYELRPQRHCCCQWSWPGCSSSPPLPLETCNTSARQSAGDHLNFRFLPWY